MVPEYKLHYFNLKAKGECPRWILSYMEADWEDVRVELHSNLWDALKPSIYSFWFEKDEEKKKASKETYSKETLPFYLKKHDEIVRENGGYLANKKLSWADFLCVVLELLRFAVDVTDVTEGCPQLHQLENTVLSTPRIQQWVAKRPNTPY